MGEIDEKKATFVILEEDLDNNKYTLTLDYKIIGMIVVGDMVKALALRKVIAKGIELDGVDFSDLSPDELVEIIAKEGFVMV